MPAFGAPELMIILVIIILFFGAGKLPQVGSALGKGIREFRKSTESDDDGEPATKSAGGVQAPHPVAAAEAPNARERRADVHHSERGYPRVRCPTPRGDRRGAHGRERLQPAGPCPASRRSAPDPADDLERFLGAHPFDGDDDAAPETPRRHRGRA